MLALLHCSWLKQSSSSVMLQLQLQSQGSLQGCIPLKLKWLDGDLLCSTYWEPKFRTKVSEVFITKNGECIKSREGVWRACDYQTLFSSVEGSTMDYQTRFSIVEGSTWKQQGLQSGMPCQCAWVAARGIELCTSSLPECFFQIIQELWTCTMADLVAEFAHMFWSICFESAGIWQWWPLAWSAERPSSLFFINNMSPHGTIL